MYKILALDGGGIRAVIQGQVLKHLEGIKYDIYVGTSGGAINAALLAMGHNYENIIELYSGEQGKKIFEPYLVPFPFHKSKYDSKNIKEVMLEIFGNLKLKDVKTNLVITAYDLISRKAILFSNLNKEHENLYIRDVVVASAAAPYYFMPHEFDKYRCIDGGLIANCPIIAAYSFIKNKFNIENPIIISIGTGSFDLPIESNDFTATNPIKFITNLLDSFLDGNMECAQEEAENILKNNYFRFQINLNKTNSSLDNTSQENIQGLLNTTKEYITNDWKLLIEKLKSTLIN